MNNQKFLDIIDSYQKQKDVQYNEYFNFIKMCDFHYQQQQYGASSFCNQSLTQPNNYYGYSLFDPTKQSNFIGEPLRANINHNVNKEISESIRPSSPVIKKNKVTIEVDVNSLSDLIKIVDKYPYDSETEYNIDLKALVNIKTEISHG